jgi:hypothetical protein|tara:strand:- start:89 stop:817 length:729 start_codon:yes stop_codon:yes gene_type:complete
MASSFSTNSKLELITTGEKAGLWGNITNTNLQILEQLSTGYLSLAVGSGDVALALDNGATSNGKNIYFKLTGTLTANRTVTVPDSAERVMVFEDATTRESSGTIKTLTIKTVSGTGVTVPSGSKVLVYSDATNVNLGLLDKGYLTVNSSSVTAYTAVAGEQIFAITNTNPITITLPAAAATGDELTIIDGGNFFASNNLTINRNSHKINAGTSNLVLNVNGQASTLVYANVTVGWVLKSTNQ